MNEVKHSQQDGLYVKVTIYDIGVNALIDTGSSITVLNPQKYYAISDSLRPPLQSGGGQLRMADGGLVTPLGIAEFRIEINGKSLTHQFIIADVEAPLVLGYDFLYRHNCQINMREGQLVIDGKCLPCQRESQMQSVFKITLSEDIIVPSNSEILVTGLIEGEIVGCEEAVVEPYKSHLAHNGILVAKAVVNPSYGCIPLRMVNLSRSSIKLYKHSCAAICEPVASTFHLEVTENDNLVGKVHTMETETNTIMAIRKTKARISTTDLHINDAVEEVESAAMWFAQHTDHWIADAQSKDDNLSFVMKWKQNGDAKPLWEHVSPYNSAVKTYWSQWDRIQLIDGKLYRKWIIVDTGEIRWQLILPNSQKNEILKMLHDDPCAGHLGVTRTIARVRSRFYWVGYKESVRQWCQKCEICQSRKGPKLRPRAAMKQYIVGAPLERVAMDVLGPFPKSNRGNKYILVIADYFTRWTEAFPMPEQNTETIANLFVEEFICRFGLPQQLHTDQGGQFQSKLFSELCSRMHIDKTKTTAFHPQSDGLVERFNRTIEDILSKYIIQNQRDWDDHLQLALLAYRSSVHESTGQTPNMMMMGREVQLPVDLIYGPPPKAEQETDDNPENEHIKHLLTRMWKIHDKARNHMMGASNRQKRYYDHKIQSRQYKIGDIVWLHTKTRKKGRSPKLQTNWEGPYHVIGVLSDLVYKIQNNPKAVPKIVHHDRLKPFYGGNRMVDRNL
ncbi:hypothetical protein ACJMK2_029154 [Sinanodonta woodiana]|uniref:Endonuclease n=2 Tax=Sinanodonta woodiana TaxID=1069815 RepID=A0ABD3XD50_SINWO